MFDCHSFCSRFFRFRSSNHFVLFFEQHYIYYICSIEIAQYTQVETNFCYCFKLKINSEIQNSINSSSFLFLGIWVSEWVSVYVQFLLRHITLSHFVLVNSTNDLNSSFQFLSFLCHTIVTHKWQKYFLGPAKFKGNYCLHFFRANTFATAVWGRMKAIKNSI